MSRFVVAVSGGIGSGKTTVTDLFKGLGVDVIDADVIARQVVEPGSLGVQKIVDKFGPEIIDNNGQLKRAKLREMIFRESALKNWLNALLHPLIREQMVLQTQQAQSPYCILSVPLLVENNLNHGVDRVLIVDVTEQTQVDRTLQRDKVDSQQIESIMNSQASREQRLAIADDIIDNNGEQAELVEQVHKLHKTYLQLAGTR
ncbi:MAG: dephospho-CoA kinase [Paraglaciecola sp.]